MAKREVKRGSKAGRFSRAKARAVAKSLRLASSKKAIPQTLSAKHTASGKGLITFRVEKILRNPNSHSALKD